MIDIHEVEYQDEIFKVTWEIDQYMPPEFYGEYIQHAPNKGVYVDRVNGVMLGQDEDIYEETFNFWEHEGKKVYVSDLDLDNPEDYDLYTSILDEIEDYGQEWIAQKIPDVLISDTSIESYDNDSQEWELYITYSQVLATGLPSWNNPNHEYRYFGKFQNNPHSPSSSWDQYDEAQISEFFFKRFKAEEFESNGMYPNPDDSTKYTFWLEVLYCVLDYKRMEEYNRGEWHLGTVIVTHPELGEKDSACLEGVESDGCEEYIQEIIENLAAEVYETLQNHRHDTQLMERARKALTRDVYEIFQNAGLQKLEYAEQLRNVENATDEQRAKNVDLAMFKAMQGLHEQGRELLGAAQVIIDQLANLNSQNDEEVVQAKLTHPSDSLFITDKDLCAGCSNLNYRPGTTDSYCSWSSFPWPGLMNEDGCIEECDVFLPLKSDETNVVREFGAGEKDG